MTDQKLFLLQKATSSGPSLNEVEEGLDHIFYMAKYFNWMHQDWERTDILIGEELAIPHELNKILRDEADRVVSAETERRQKFQEEQTKRKKSYKVYVDALFGIKDAS